MTNLSLSALLQPDVEPLAALTQLVAEIRPGRGKNGTPSERLQQLISLLKLHTEIRNTLRLALLQLFGSRHAVLLLVTAGIYPETGVMSESLRRISHKLLPEADDQAQLKDALGQIFQRSDAAWLETTETEVWCALIEVLEFDQAPEQQGLLRLREGLLEALRVVAHRVAAAGLEPEMLRLDVTLENHASPFLALCEEALVLARANGPEAPQAADERHLAVLVDQCRQAIVRVRRRAEFLGASFHLTFRLRRLTQHLDRLERLAELVCLLGRDDRQREQQAVAGLWRELAIAECRRNDLRHFWRSNAELVALRVTENAGRSGEHYITESRSEQLSMLRSAAGGGFIIAFMAAGKVFLGSLHLAPLAEVLAYCLNYGLGFVLIHILQFTVATKQPAMTANAIAAAMGEVEGNGRSRQRDLEPLVTLVARTVRTQLAAIVGNLGMAVPVAMLIGYYLYVRTGEHFLTTTKAQVLLHDIHPFAGGALVYAAIAGVCLFLAGLIAGYYDNLCAYNRIPERLYQLRGLRRLFGASRWQRFTEYIGNNLGALAGNFFFGFLLGGVAGLGMLLGLPIDIRHIAFSAAYWGYAMLGLGFAVEWQVAAATALGVLLIGLTNLVVSFYLALTVGLKSRGVDFAQRIVLGRAILKRVLTQPGQFFLAPKADAQAADVPGP